MAAQLPAELTDAIVDFLHSDRRSLSSCSLVCRNWLPVTRYHFFHRMEITARNVESLVDLLNSSSCSITITHHVIHIHLHIYQNHTPILIVPYLERFVAIMSLTLRLARNDFTICKEIEERLPRGSARFMKMDLTGISSCLNPVDNPKLTFTLGDISNVDSPPTFLSRLRSLHPVIDDKIPELSWLLSVAQFPAIADVSLHHIKKRHLADIQAILRIRGPSIHSIELGFIQYGSDMVAIGDRMDLSPSTNLRSLAIGIEFNNVSGGTGSFSISKIISKISSLYLTNIRVDIWALSVGCFTDTRRVDWKELAGVLNHPQFSQVRNVSVYLMTKHYSSAKCEAWVRKEMSSLATSRGFRCVSIF